MPHCDCGRPAKGSRAQDGTKDTRTPWFFFCSRWSPQGGGCKYFRWRKQNPIIHDIVLALVNLGDIRKANQLRLEYRTMVRLSHELGNRHPETQSSVTSLADILDSVSDLPQAAQAIQDLFEMRRRVLGLEDPVTMSTLGSLDKAVGMHECRVRHFLGDRAYEDILLSWGIAPHEHDFYESRACEERKKASFQELATTLRTLLELERHSLGDEHPNTMDTAKLLADFLHRAGDLPQAIQVYRELLHVQRRIVGPEELATINTSTSLGNLLILQGISSHRPWGQERELWAEAAQLYQETVEAQRHVLGAEHPDTVHSLNQLASCLTIAGNLPHAAEIYRNLLEVQQQVLGLEDPAVLSTACSLGHVLEDEACSANKALEQQKDHFAEAEVLYRNIIDARVSKFGWEHEDTINVAWKLALLLEKLYERGLSTKSSEDSSREDPLGEASSLFKRVFELRRRMFGSNHEDTILAVEKATVNMARLKMPSSRLAKRNVPNLCANCGTAFSVRTFDPSSASRYIVRQHRCPCKQVCYCSVDCQRLHWPIHKKECQSKRVKGSE